MLHYFEIALDNEVKPAELSETITHLAFYSGWSSVPLDRADSWASLEFPTACNSMESRCSTPTCTFTAAPLPCGGTYRS